MLPSSPFQVTFLLVILNIYFIISHKNGSPVNIRICNILLHIYKVNAEYNYVCKEESFWSHSSTQYISCLLRNLDSLSWSQVSSTKNPDWILTPYSFNSILILPSLPSLGLSSVILPSSFISKITCKQVMHNAGIILANRHIRNLNE